MVYLDNACSGVLSHPEHWKDIFSWGPGTPNIEDLFFYFVGYQCEFRSNHEYSSTKCNLLPPNACKVKDLLCILSLCWPFWKWLWFLSATTRWPLAVSKLVTSEGILGLCMTSLHYIWLIIRKISYMKKLNVNL